MRQPQETRALANVSVNRGRYIRRPNVKEKGSMSKLFTVAATIVMLTGLTLGQRLGSANRQSVALVRTVYFGPLLPHSAGAPATVELPLHLSIPRAVDGGYQISAVANLVFTPAALAAGGKSITASDIGVGITSGSSAPGAN